MTKDTERPPDPQDESATAEQRVQASADEGIRLVRAYRAISSPAVRAKILTLVAIHAQRSAGEALH